MRKIALLCDVYQDSFRIDWIISCVGIVCQPGKPRWNAFRKELNMNASFKLLKGLNMEYLVRILQYDKPMAKPRFIEGEVISQNIMWLRNCQAIYYA